MQSWFGTGFMSSSWHSKLILKFQTERRLNAERRAKIHRSESRPTEEVMAKSDVEISTNQKTKLEKETEYDGHKRSDRSRMISTRQRKCGKGASEVEAST